MAAMLRRRCAGPAKGQVANPGVAERDQGVDFGSSATRPRAALENGAAHICNAALGAKSRLRVPRPPGWRTSIAAAQDADPNMPAPPAAPVAPRFDRLDALRGAAIVWMAAFHLAFDLNHFGWLRPKQNFYADPLWTVQRSCIVSLFLFVAGLSLAVALQAGQTWPRFWRRWAQVAGCALLVSIGSALMFPNSWISFGVLHGIAVMLVLARLAAPLKRWLWPLGAACILLPALVQDAFFDSRWTNWVGLVTRKPVTEDFVPVLPWLGVVLFGLAAGQWLLRTRPQWLAGPLLPPARPLAVLGRWSLSFYMLHQPVLIGTLMALQALRGS
jgi:uncharacterized membrane protein